MYKLTIGAKKIDLERKITDKIDVRKLINNTEDNVEKIIIHSKIYGKKPFNGSKKVLKEWLKSNQGYDKYVPEVFYYFCDKCKL